jgi:hypothetical protein
VLQHVARLVTRLVARLIVDYSASRRLVIDYFTTPCVRLLRHVAWLVA